MTQTTTHPMLEKLFFGKRPLEAESSRVNVEKAEITQLLDDWNEGDSEALDRLLPRVYEELKRIARREFRDESAGHTLQPTAVIHEVFLRLKKQRKVQWRSRNQFFAVAAQLIRRILIEHARGKRRQKRGGGAKALAFDEALHVGRGTPEQWVALDDALEGLARLQPRQCRVVELKIFTDLALEEIAEVLSISRTTVTRDWRMAVLWLRRELSSRSDTG